MGRSPGSEKFAVKKGPWNPEEDLKLLAYIEEHGRGSWTALPTKAGLQRCGKSCRLRWTNYLRPDIKRGKFSLQEEQSIIQLHALLGNRWGLQKSEYELEMLKWEYRWSAIAAHLPKRTDNEIKNHWNTHLKKRLAQMGIDPVTHKPRSDALTSADGHSNTNANLSHTAQWESARLEAEARLARESKLCSVTAATSPTSPSATASFHATAFPCLHDVLRAWQGQGVLPTTGKGVARIGLESPTSTSSFSENGNNAVRVETAKETADWKYLDKATRALDGVVDIETDMDKTAANASMEQRLGGLTSTLLGSGGENPWPHEYSLKQRGAGNLTEMLLEKYSDVKKPSPVADSANEEDVGGGSGPEEENKSYWNGLLNPVNSSAWPPLF